MLQPEIEPIQENLISLADHEPFRSHREGLGRIDGDQPGNLFSPEQGFHIVRDPDISRTFFYLFRNFFILIVTENGCLGKKGREMPVIEPALVEDNFHPGSVDGSEIRKPALICFPNEGTGSESHIRIGVGENLASLDIPADPAHRNVKFVGQKIRRQFRPFKAHERHLGLKGLA